MNNLMRRRGAGVVVGNPKKRASVTSVTTSDLDFFRRFVVEWRDGRAVIDFRVQHERNRTDERAIFVEKAVVADTHGLVSLSDEP